MAIKVVFMRVPWKDIREKVCAALIAHKLLVTTKNGVIYAPRICPHSLNRHWWFALGYVQALRESSDEEV